MESNEIIVQAANLLIHKRNVSQGEEILGVETLYYEDKIYQLQVCLIPTKIKPELEETDVHKGVETSHILNIEILISSLNKIKTDSGIGEYTDITYLVQYLYVQGVKYGLELRMTTTHPQMILFEQLN